jgi:hypothetical protein
MFFICTVRTVVLVFNRQIFVIFVDTHISSVYFIISDFLFSIFIVIHLDDIFCKYFINLFYLHIVVISVYGSFQFVKNDKGALPLCKFRTVPFLAIIGIHLFTVIESEIKILAILADFVDRADNQQVGRTVVIVQA